MSDSLRRVGPTFPPDMKWKYFIEPFPLGILVHYVILNNFSGQNITHFKSTIISDIAITSSLVLLLGI